MQHAHEGPSDFDAPSFKNKRGPPLQSIVPLCVFEMEAPSKVLLDWPLCEQPFPLMEHFNTNSGMVKARVVRCHNGCSTQHMHCPRLHGATFHLSAAQNHGYLLCQCAFMSASVRDWYVQVHWSVIGVLGCIGTLGTRLLQMGCERLGGTCRGEMHAPFSSMCTPR